MSLFEELFNFTEKNREFRVLRLKHLMIPLALLSVICPMKFCTGRDVILNYDIIDRIINHNVFIFPVMPFMKQTHDLIILRCWSNIFKLLTINNICFSVY